jgi:transposase
VFSGRNPAREAPVKGKRHELTDAAWAKIAPLLPKDARRGQKWRDHRSVLNGILWKLSTGVPWRDVPERYGPWQTLHARLLRWQRDGTWERVLRHVQQQSDAVGELVWEVSVDSSVVRAHQHAAGGKGGTPSRRSAAAGAGSRPSSTSRARAGAGRWRCA